MPPKGRKRKNDDIQEEKISKTKLSEGDNLRDDDDAEKKEEKGDVDEKGEKEIIITEVKPKRVEELKNFFEKEEQEGEIKALHKMWRFLVVVHFCEHFKEFLSLPKYKPPELEIEIHSKYQSPLITDLIIALLRNIRQPKSITKETYLKSLKNLINKYILDFPEGNPLKSEPEFHTLDLDVKVKILHCLCEWVLEENATIKEKLQSWQSDEQKVRPLPLGYDRYENSYWRFGETSRYLYIERPVTVQKKKEVGGDWRFLFSSTSEWEKLASSLEGSKHTDEKEFYSFLSEELIPPLVAKDLKKERKKKKLTRAAISITNIINRPRRAVKRVDYNYSYYDNIAE